MPSSLQSKLLLGAAWGECSPSKMEALCECTCVRVRAHAHMCRWMKKYRKKGRASERKRERNLNQKKIKICKIPNWCLWQLALLGFLSQSQGDRWHLTLSLIRLQRDKWSFSCRLSVFLWRFIIYTSVWTLNLYHDTLLSLSSGSLSHKSHKYKHTNMLPPDIVVKLLLILIS